MNMLDALAHSLGLFREIDPDIQANAILVFLEVANAGEAGISMQSIEKATRLSQAAVSRNVAMFTEWTRLRVPGPALVERREDPMNRRQKIVSLTAKGRDFVKELQKAKT